MADGFYIGGFQGKTPTTYVHLDPEKGEATIKAPTKITIDAPQIELKGAVTMSGASAGDTMTLNGSISTTGDITTPGTVTAGHFVGPVN